MTEENELPTVYDATEVEPKWYAFWEEQGYFRGNDDPSDARATYAITFPPPNVTGSLHMGHACRVTFPDAIIRYQRMMGKNVAWVPGMDHAGIATQIIVERKLAKEGKSRHDLGRQAFVDRVWQWKGESGGRILKQIRELGGSLDWDRTLFTLDEGPARAVREVFVRLYEEGLIYRATRLINWDIKLKTALSDLEVETKENVEGKLFDFAYPLADGDGEVVVSTTRPETMLGDTAVAIHPDDERYKHLHGKSVRHPFVDREVPIICDAELVDMKFGTGVVKVTPAHDPNDFETGKRHNLEELNILNLDGTLNELCGDFAGMDRFVARKAVMAALEEKGLARGIKKHTMTLPISQRSGEVVEPMISTQWFVKMEPLAKPAIEAVENGSIQILPQDWTKTYFHWMKNIQDWCISRQLWWGHPIPAWYCGACEHVTVSRTDATVCSKCGSSDIKQDDDVLDTWFSSALWPFSTLGWPDADDPTRKPDALAKFYPTQDMETGYDILFFWVARMIMMGLKFMGEVPFKRVLLAGIVTDEKGDKMSKTKGNVIDPLDVIRGASIEELFIKAERDGGGDRAQKYLKKNYPDGFPAFGADALRLTLLSYSPQSRRIALSLKRVEGYRNFCNKLWNASRFALMNLDGHEDKARDTFKPADAKHVVNRWVLSRLAVAIESAHQGINDYRIDDATLALYHFVWDEFCDWYLELSKSLLISSDPTVARETRQTLLHVLETTLRALHPMAPFITEEIWQRVPKGSDAKPSIMIDSYPDATSDSRRDDEAERVVELLQGVIGAGRAVRTEHELPRSTSLPMLLKSDKPGQIEVMNELRELVESLCIATIETVDAQTVIPKRSSVAVVEGLSVIVPLEGLVDSDKERSRIERSLQKLEKDLQIVEKKLSNKGFVDRAPADVVQKERARLDSMSDERTKLKQALDALR